MDAKTNILFKKKELFLLPFIIILAIPFFVYAIKQGEFRYFLAAIFTVIIPFMIRATVNIKPFLFIVLSLPVLVISITFNTMVFDYDSYVNIGVWTALFDTHASESMEFVTETSLTTKIVSVIQIITYLFYLRYSYEKRIFSISKKYRLIILGLLVLLIIDFSSKGATKITFPFRGIEGLVKYKKHRNYEAQFFNNRENILVNATQHKDFKNDEKEALIIIIGESLRRDHLGYYGYHRNTTPYLENEDIILFTDVISPSNQTLNSLKRALSGAEYLNDAAYYQKPSFIKAFNKAGFKSYWLSTQRMYGRTDSEISFIAKESDSIIFRNNYNHDGILTKNLHEVLALDEPKKLIIIHILGNHFSYDKRHPPAYTKYKKEKYTDSKEKDIDQYDNSVRYNDFVLYSYLSELKKIKGNNTFIMFSDHGESLYDDLANNIMAHGSTNPAKSEYDIPFILWFSNEYKKNHPINVQNTLVNKDHSIILSDFYHSIPSLYGITFPEIVPEKDFFGNLYQPLPNRKVLNSNFELLEYNKLKNARSENN